MEPSTVASVNSAVASQRATTQGFDDLSSEDFFALLIAELQAQDPLDPKDNEQLLSQMSNIRQMEQNAALTKTLETLAGEQQFGSTAGLIGNFVAGTVVDQAGLPTELRGVVIGVRFEGDGGAILELHNGHSLPAEKVEQITLVENLPTDILEQLEAELAAAGAGTPEGSEDTAAKIAQGLASRRDPTVGDYARDWGQRLDVVGGLLDSLFSPGIGIGVGR